jgi:hypothetical protein
MASIAPNDDRARHMLGYRGGRRLLAAAAMAATAVGAMIACDARGGDADSAGADAARSRGGSTADSGWVALFDGTDLARWRGYRRQDVPASWRVEGDALAFVPGGDSAARGDIITRDQYGDFELAYEWKVAPAGNSGVMYRAGESHQFVWETGPEMQVLDNGRHPDGKNPLTSAGAAYGLYAAASDVTRPVGEWNAARIVARGPHVEHWLNGTKLVEYEQGSEDWRRRVRESKFGTLPAFGTLRRGHIALQDHGDRVWYRDIRIRQLDGGA